MFSFMPDELITTGYSAKSIFLQMKCFAFKCLKPYQIFQHIRGEIFQKPQNVYFLVKDVKLPY